MSPRIERVPKKKKQERNEKRHIVSYISIKFQNSGVRKDLKSFQGRKIKFGLKEWHQTSQ